jgi:hypothetical protein
MALIVFLELEVFDTGNRLPIEAKQPGRAPSMIADVGSPKRVGTGQGRLSRHPDTRKDQPPQAGPRTVPVS